MKNREALRVALENPETLTLIKSLISKRGVRGNPDIIDTLVTDTVIELLTREDYYESKYQHGLGSFIGLVITTVLRRTGENKDALDGELLYLDTPIGDDSGDEHLTIHDLFSEQDVFADVPTFVTQAGIPERMTYYLSQIPDTQADAFILRYVYGYTASEAAELLNTTAATVNSYVRDAKIALAEHRRSEEAYEVKLEIGDACGRIISNNESSAGVWADWSWQERHAQPGPVYEYSREEVAAYARERGLNYIN